MPLEEWMEEEAEAKRKIQAELEPLAADLTRAGVPGVVVEFDDRVPVTGAITLTAEGARAILRQIGKKNAGATP